MKKNKELPLVSIITVVKNNVTTIERTILSVLNQDYQNIEYIVIDGNSTDGTTEIIRKYKDYFSFLLVENDRSTVDGLNKSLNYFKGDFVFFLNGDDWIEKEFVTIAMNFFIKESCSWIYGDMYYWQNNKKVSFIKSSETVIRKLKYTMTINYPTVVFKKECFIGRQFDERYKVAPDYDFLLRLENNQYKGKYCKDLKCNFSLGGNSTKNLYSSIKGIKDVFLSSLRNNKEIIKPTYYFIKTMAIIFLKYYKIVK